MMTAVRGRLSPPRAAVTRLTEASRSQTSRPRTSGLRDSRPCCRSYFTGPTFHAPSTLTTASKTRCLRGSPQPRRRHCRHFFLHERPDLSLIHISEPTRRTPISYAVFCLKKKKKKNNQKHK